MNSLPIASELYSPPESRTHADVCAVMVTYNPEPCFELNVLDLLPQVGKLIIVDNQSLAEARGLINQVASVRKVEVIWNDQNLGIASALNRGIDRALASRPYSWIATFDQDSRVPPNYLTTLFESYSACPFRKQVAMIGATYTLPAVGRASASMFLRNGSAFREVKTLMTSGSLLQSSAFLQCGGFDQSLFMDCVDHEFCLCLRRHGFKVIQAKQALLEHRLGAPTSHRILWKRFISTNHSPSRRYSNAHNRMLVYRRYLSSEALWVLHDVFGWFQDTVKVILVERNRMEKLVSIAKGAWDAMREPAGTRQDRWSEPGRGVE